MQNFSQESLTVIAQALELQIELAKKNGLINYVEEAIEALEVVNEYLNKEA